VSSLCFSWVTLFTPPFSDLGLLSRTVCSPRIQNKGFRIPGWRRKQRKPSSPQKPVSGKELPLTFHQSPHIADPRIHVYDFDCVQTMCIFRAHRASRAFIWLIPTIGSSGLQPVPANTGIARRTSRSSFKNALQMARTFPFGVLASQVCPYCYNTGYSSPGTRCSYCRMRNSEEVRSGYVRKLQLRG